MFNLIFNFQNLISLFYLLCAGYPAYPSLPLPCSCCFCCTAPFLCSCVFFETCPLVSLACISVRAKTWSLLLYEAASTHHRPCWCCTAGRKEWLLLLAVPPRGSGALLWALPQGVPRQVPQTTSRARGRLVLSRVWGISRKMCVYCVEYTYLGGTAVCKFKKKLFSLRFVTALGIWKQGTKLWK